MNKAIFTEEANQDLREAVLWYEKGLRKTSLNSFPYFIYYAFNKSPLVLVIAIWHKSRLKDIVDIRAINISK